MKLKPGKYMQRDGGIATVAAVDESNGHSPCVGWNSDGIVSAWGIYGEFSAIGGTHKLDLIREYREPREGWAVIFTNPEDAEKHAESLNTMAYRVREVIA